MKLILKSLKQVEYEIYIDSDQITVKEFKKEIEKLYSFDSEQIKLIFNGTILENPKILSNYNITENSQIIMMNVKTKKLNNENINKQISQGYSEKNPQINSNVEHINKSSISKIINTSK